MSNQNVQEGKTAAIISYLTIIGLVIAFIMNNSKKNTFSSFHIRQSIGITLLSIAVNIAGSFLGNTIAGLLSLLILVLIIIGLIGAFKGEEKRIPILGDLFQDWFKGIS